MKKGNKKQHHGNLTVRFDDITNSSNDNIFASTTVNSLMKNPSKSKKTQDARQLKTHDTEYLKLLSKLIEELENQENQNRELIEKNEFYGREKTPDEQNFENELIELWNNRGGQDQKKLLADIKPKIEQLQLVEKDLKGRSHLEREALLNAEEIERKRLNSEEVKDLEIINLELDHINSKTFDLAAIVKSLEVYLKINHGLKVIAHSENDIIKQNQQYISLLAKGITYGYYDPLKNEMHYQECDNIQSREITNIKLEILSNINKIRKNKPPIAKDDPRVSERLNEIIRLFNKENIDEINQTKIHELLHAATYAFYQYKYNGYIPVPCSSNNSTISDNVKGIVYVICQMNSKSYLSYEDDQFQSEIITHLHERLIDKNQLKKNLTKGDYANLKALDPNTDKEDLMKALKVIKNSFTATREAFIKNFPKELKPLIAIQSLIINDLENKMEELRKISKDSSLGEDKNNTTTATDSKELQKWVERIEKTRSERINDNGRDN